MSAKNCNCNAKIGKATSFMKRLISNHAHNNNAEQYFIENNDVEPVDRHTAVNILKDRSIELEMIYYMGIINEPTPDSCLPDTVNNDAIYHRSDPNNCIYKSVAGDNTPAKGILWVKSEGPKGRYKIGFDKDGRQFYIQEIGNINRKDVLKRGQEFKEEYTKKYLQYKYGTGDEVKLTGPIGDGDGKLLSSGTPTPTPSCVDECECDDSCCCYMCDCTYCQDCHNCQCGTKGCPVEGCESYLNSVCQCCCTSSPCNYPCCVDGVFC